MTFNKESTDSLIGVGDDEHTARVFSRSTTHGDPTLYLSAHPQESTAAPQPISDRAAECSFRRAGWSCACAICAPTAGAAVQPTPSAQGPDELWLQLHGDCHESELSEPVDYTDDSVTWCWHKIHDSDVRYVRAGAVHPGVQAVAWKLKARSLLAVLEDALAPDGWSNDDGDHWFESADDAELVDGKALGEEFELLASIYSYPVRYRIARLEGDETFSEPVTDEIKPSIRKALDALKAHLRASPATAPSVQPPVPDDVAHAAQLFVAAGYRGPLHMARMVFDWVNGLSIGAAPGTKEGGERG